MCPLLVLLSQGWGKLETCCLGQMEEGADSFREAENRHVGAKFWNIYTRQETSSCRGLLLPRETWQTIKVVVKTWDLQSTRKGQVCRGSDLCSWTIGMPLRIYNSRKFLADSSWGLLLFLCLLGLKYHSSIREKET